jgi:hypothetical protein
MVSSETRAASGSLFSYFTGVLIVTTTLQAYLQATQKLGGGKYTTGVAQCKSGKLIRRLHMKKKKEYIF